ncbi:hypothetical protein RDWZM_007667 [Blomia tropicalis]|uniref:Uncharacterized protein n=1 Tax=Blomia tropicalis TaxID=40697 RepID=A0A9Q0LZJ4_BLOTA|nr:hypothetical protein RDWZM_007667 [Blomia tropicalis]
MNFKKSNKDVKRASYYVWFLGSKESKGLRGDEYVTPVLNYMLDNECNLEPSKVTLQVSNKGMKIIQILTVPRKSSKLNSDQQAQLFANVHHQRTGANVSNVNEQCSVLKTEQVKHHIPHNSITWVYQEDDVICAILLLYNPITRCPVHVHAYRCDSVETADNLRQQLQTLVARPENQKKFRDIESRLVAKGLLLPPNGFQYSNLDDVVVDHHSNIHQNHNHHHHHHHHHHHESRYQGKNNSDGRSTRTEGSDENSEESNSSDLGYAIRSKSGSNDLRYNQKSNGNEGKFVPQQQQQSSMMSLMMMGGNELKQSANNGPMSLQPFHSSSSATKNDNNKINGLVEKTNKQLKSNKHESNEIDTIGHGQSATAALYDSLAAELRAKLGNPKMGPILLPPRDYDAQTIIDNNNKKKNDKNKNSNKQYSLSRSESSGKSSSGIGSDEALANENQTKKSQPKQQQSTQSNQQQQQQQQQQGLPSSYFRHNRHYRTDILMDEQHNRRSDGGTGPQSFIDIDRRKRHSMAGYLYGNDRTDKSLYNSLQMYNSSEDEIDDDDEFDDDVEDEVNLDDEDFEMPIVDQVDAEDIEEDVIFTTSATVNESNRRSKMISNNNHQRQPNRSSSSEMRNKTRIDRQTSQFHEYDNRRNVPLAKMYASNPNISRMPLKEVKHQQQQQQQQQPTIPSSNRNNISNNNGDKFVIGRREQRQQQQQQNRRPKQYYFADAEFSESKPSDRRWSSQRYLARSNGNLVHEGSGPTSLAIHPHSNDRSVSPAYIYTERIDPRVMSQTKSSHYNHLQHQQQPQQQQQLKSNHSVPMKASRSSTNLARGPISSRFDSFDHYPHPHHQMEPTPLKTSPSSTTTTTTKHQQQHTSNLMNTPAAIAASAAAAIALRNKKKQLEQPFSRYSYAEHVHHGINNNNRESLFSNTNGHNLNYLLPARR